MTGIYSGDANEIPGDFNGKFFYVTGATTAKHYPANGNGALFMTSFGTLGIQLYYVWTFNTVYVRTKSSSWSAWQVISTDIPSFYKDYANVGELGKAGNNSNGFVVINEFAGTKTTQIEMVQEFVDALTVTGSSKNCFIVHGIYTYGTRKYIYGYIYANKKNGAFTFVDTNGVIINYYLNNGTVTLVQ